MVGLCYCTCCFVGRPRQESPARLGRFFCFAALPLCRFAVTFVLHVDGILFTIVDVCASSLSRGHGNLLCIVPILKDDPRRESSVTRVLLASRIPRSASRAAPRGRPKGSRRVADRLADGSVAAPREFREPGFWAFSSARFCRGFAVSVNLRNTCWSFYCGKMSVSASLH